MSGELISITLSGGEVFRGDIQCVDPVTKSLFIKDRETGAFTLINAASIKKIDGDLSKVATPDPAKLGITVQLDNAKIQNREGMAMEKAEKDLNSINLEVDGKVQELFLRLRKLYDSFRWEGVDMVVFDMCISPPYETVRTRNGATADDGLERLKKVLSSERSKLKM
jgi:hypothetical protein